MAITERACEIAKSFLGGERADYDRAAGIRVLVKDKTDTVVATLSGGYMLRKASFIIVPFNKHEARKHDGIGKLREYVETQCSIALMIGDA